MNTSIKSIAIAIALIVLNTSVYAGPGTTAAFERLKNREPARSDSLSISQHLPSASQRYQMDQRLAWSKAQSEKVVDTEIAVFETAKPAYRPTKR